MFCELQQEKKTDDLALFVEAMNQHVPTRQQIERLEAEMKNMSQANTMVTDHYFVPGMYCRKLWRQKGTLIVGKVHKAPHFFMCLTGAIVAWSDKGMVTLRPGDVLECKPGTKRVTLALDDSVGLTVHKTDKTDLAEIEAELIEEDTTALFDSYNKIKPVLIEGEA